MGFKMKYEIKKQYLTPGSKRRSGIKMPYVGFNVAHDTGNPGSTAKGNVGHYENSRNTVYASAQVFVDDKEILECIPFLTGPPEKAWHVLYNVTTDNKMYGADANDVAGGIELCWGPGINSAEAYKRYLWVMAYACYKFKLNPAKHVVGHDILDPGRKIDPTNALKYMGKTYAGFIKDLVAEYNDCLGKQVAEQPKVVAVSNSSTYTVEAGDTFWGIAQRSNGAFSVQDLIAWNPTLAVEELKVGAKINIKKPEVKKEVAKKPADTKKAPVKAAPAPAKKKVEMPAPTVMKGNTGKNALLAQQALAALHFYPEKGAKDNGCDGFFGAKSENAAQRFQMVHGLEIDGRVGAKTIAKLNSLLN